MMERTREGDPKTPPHAYELTRPSKPAPQGSWLWLATAVAAALIIATVLLGSVWFLLRPLALLFVGITLAAALAPVVTWLQQWLKRTAATLAVYLVLVLLFVGIGWLIFPPVIEEAGQLIDRAPELYDQGQTWLQQNLPMEDIPVLDTVFSQISGIASTIVALPLEISSSLADIVLVLFISFYALVAAPEFHHFLLSLVPERHHEKAKEVMHGVPYAMGGYIRGASISGAIIGTLSYVGLTIIGVNFAVLLGIISALGEYIPYVGPFISGALIVIVAFLQSPTKALIAIGFALALQQLEGSIIAPNVMHPQTKISPLTTLFVVFAGWSVGGALGALVAIPIAAAIRVLIMQLVVPAVRRQTGAVANGATEPEREEAA